MSQMPDYLDKEVEKILEQMEHKTLKGYSNKADNGKIQMNLLYSDMAKGLEAISAVLTYGREKYEARGWKKVDRDRYVDALFRHHTAIERGEAFDEESGLPHIAHMACNMMFLLQFDLDDKHVRTDWTKWNKPPQDHKES